MSDRDFEIEGIEVPVQHSAVRGAWRFLDQLTLKRVDGWSVKQVTDLLRELGYRPETVSRFADVVELRYQRLLTQAKRVKESRRVHVDRTPPEAKGEEGD